MKPKCLYTDGHLLYYYAHTNCSPNHHSNNPNKNNNNLHSSRTRGVLSSTFDRNMFCSVRPQESMPFVSWISQTLIYKPPKYLIEQHTSFFSGRSIVCTCKSLPPPPPLSMAAAGDTSWRVGGGRKRGNGANYPRRLRRMSRKKWKILSCAKEWFRSCRHKNT